MEKPTDTVFADIKQAAISIWNNYDNTYGYVDEKLNRIDQIKNFKDNWYTFFGMMDSVNQGKCIKKLKLEETKVFLRQNQAKYGIFVDFL